jgi:hypothetical protein
VTAATWIAGRQPEPPASLASHLRTLVAANAEPDVPAALLSIALRELELLLATADTSRGTAVDLLAVDALITYAFEAAAADPSTLAERARASEVAIARLLEARSS